MSRSLTSRTGRRGLGALAALAVCLGGVVLAPSATAYIGENFGMAPVSDPDSGTSASAFAGVEALPDSTSWWAGTCSMRNGDAAVGALPVLPFAHCIDHPGASGDESPAPPLAAGVPAGTSGPDGWTNPPTWRVEASTEAGSHPDGTAAAWFTRSPEAAVGALGGTIGPDGAPRSITVSLPPGVIGNPNAIAKCSSDALRTVPTICPPKAQAGAATVSFATGTAVLPVYNADARVGRTAEFVVSGAGTEALNANVPITGTARTDGDFGIDALAVQIPSGIPVRGQTVTFWGVPWASSHALYRPVAGYCGRPASSVLGMGGNGLTGGTARGCSQAAQHYDPSWGPIRPFLTLPTECASQAPVTSILSDNWQSNVLARATSVAPLMTDCDDVPFEPTFSLEPTSKQADGPSGLDVVLRTPQNNDPPAAVRFNPDDDTGAPAHWASVAGRATSHLDKTVVTLPEGMAVNPSGASGLDGCSDAEIGITQLGNPPIFNNEDPFDGLGAECPAGSVIGSAEVTTPLLDETLTGQVVLGDPKSTDPQSGQMFRLFIVIRNNERGLLAKVFGSAVADPNTGKLTATFDKNPRVPFEELKLSIKGGQRGMLALPQRCDGSLPWNAQLKPWSSDTSVPAGGSMETDVNCGHGFAPGLDAGMDTQRGGARGSFSFTFSRTDGEQWFQGLTATLPQGLLASVKGVPLCTNAQANANACPAGSRIGTVDAAAGSGTPFILEKKGTAYLTEGYKGAPYGLAVSVPVEAGPFKGQFALTPIVVRQALHVDRSDAHVTAISDPFPKIWHGVPLRVRKVTVKVDRPNFMINPTDCSPKSIGAEILSTEGTTVKRSVPFQASGCGALGFKPKLSMRFTGKRQTRTNGHPGVRAVVTQLGGEAGVERAEVRLPLSLALDPDNAQALCEFVDGTKDDIEKRCPKGSIVGRARATSPLLNDPLVGNVYFVKNIRIDPKTGNQIRTLPMIIVALRGEIAINLRGVSSTTSNGRLVNTFAGVPDAPLERFNLNLTGGKNGILAVTRKRNGNAQSICGKQIVEADFDGQNGRRYDRDVKAKTPCNAGKKRDKAGGKGARRR